MMDETDLLDWMGIQQSFNLQALRIRALIRNAVCNACCSLCRRAHAAALPAIGNKALFCSLLAHYQRPHKPNSASSTPGPQRASLDKNHGH